VPLEPEKPVCPAIAPEQPIVPPVHRVWRMMGYGRR
jgi:hypothetical protein